MPASAGVVSFLVVGVLLVFAVCGAVEVASLYAFVAFLPAVLECGLDGGVGVDEQQAYCFGGSHRVQPPLSSRSTQPCWAVRIGTSSG